MQWHGSVIPALLHQDGRWRQENCPEAVWLATWSTWESQERPCLWRFSSDPHTLPEYECLELALETTLASESYSHLRLPPECCKQRWVPPWPSKSVFFKKLHVCMLYLYDSPVLHSPSNFKLIKERLLILQLQWSSIIVLFTPRNSLTYSSSLFACMNVCTTWACCPWRCLRPRLQYTKVRYESALGKAIENFTIFYFSSV